MPNFHVKNEKGSEEWYLYDGKDLVGTNGPNYSHKAKPLLAYTPRNEHPTDSVEEGLSWLKLQVDVEARENLERMARAVRRIEEAGIPLKAIVGWAEDKGNNELRKAALNATSIEGAIKDTICDPNTNPGIISEMIATLGRR